MNLDEQLVASRLARATAGLFAGLTPAELLETAAALLVVELDAALAGVCTLDRDGVLVPRAWRGSARPPSGSLPTALSRAAARKQRLRIDALARDPGFDAAWAAREGLRACASEPLALDEHPRGALVIFLRRDLDPPTLELLQALSALTSRAVEIGEQIEARQRVETLARELSDQQRWLESVLDLMPIPLVLVEADSARVLFANRVADRMAGGELPRMVPAERYHEVYYVTDQDGRRLPLDEMPGVRAARSERLDGIELYWHTPGGVRAVMVDSAPLPASFGHAAAAVIGFTEVTALKQAQAELEEAVRARDVFLSIASHELRTPLTSMRLHIETLLHAAQRETPALPPRVSDRVAAARSQIDRLAMLVDNLLNVSRISSGQLSLAVETTDLRQVVREVSAQLGIELERAGCTLLLRAPEAVMGLWDRVRLGEIVLNLASNAVKFGRGKPIEISVESDGVVARLVVRDHGIGIPVEEQHAIFERFERAVAERHYDGIGMGLWIVRQIVEAHGGRIVLDSRPGEGSTFTVELPLPSPDTVALH